MFTIVDSNPNENTGGGGCLCSGELKSGNCDGPFVLFPAADMESGISPFAVLCKRCLNEAAAALEKAEKSGQLLSGGDKLVAPASDGRNKEGRNGLVGQELPVDVDL